MVRSNEKNSQVGDLVDKCDEEALISFLSSISALLPNSTFKPFIAVSGANLVTKSDDKTIKQLTEMMQSLILSIRIIQTHLSQAQKKVS